MKRKLTSIALSVLLLTLTACSDTSQRVVKAISAIPSVVRVFAPDARPEVFSALDAASRAFNIFISDRTSDNWTKAERAWDAAKPLLNNLHNERISQIVVVVDLLLSQVGQPSDSSVASAPMSSEKPKFDEETVRRLESLVKVN